MVASENHVAQHGSFELSFAAKDAFPLFSPEGERLWVPHWDPTPIYPAENIIRWKADSVFTLERDGELLTWWIIEVDHLQRRASYVYFAPGRAVRVTVRVESTSENSCRVEVTYLTTATDEAGERHVTNACSMDSRMKDWKRLIQTALPDDVVPSITQ